LILISKLDDLPVRGDKTPAYAGRAGASIAPKIPSPPSSRGSVDEVAFLLGHRDGTVTRTVYVREVADARRRALRRSRMAAEYPGALRAAFNDDTNDGRHGSA
jgi:integrase